MNAGRILMSLGLFLFVLGAILYVLPRIGLPIGRLPGDLRFRNENFTCIIPLATSLILSILLTIVLNLLIRILNR